MPIRLLSPLLINQIAAGEVVERPASVIKELIENAIDAAAGHISIEIEGGGLHRMQVVDDGSGIPAGELALAVSAHATSKISSPEDLDGVGTMGFRGEALASIASVSRIEIRSRPPGASEAAMLEVQGERMEGPRPASGSPGTSVTVHQLFGAVPARRKFLKSEAAETRRVSRVVQRLAMSHPDIAFRLQSNGRELLDFAARLDLRQRILDVMGPELDEQMLDLEIEREGVVLQGLLGKPEIARPTSQHQQFYLNGRPITDARLSHALREAYRGLIEPRRFPTAVLFLRVDPRRVDVNVHPAKTEVRFRDDRMLYSVVRQGVLERLQAADLTPPLTLPSTASSDRLFGSTGTRSARSRPQPAVGSSSDPRGFSIQAAREEAQRLENVPPVTPLPEADPLVTALQVHKSFIVAEDPEGLIIIDQHALHERMMFEQLLSRVTAGNLPTQRLLVPEIIEAGEVQFEGLDRLQNVLERLGLELTPAGPRSIGIHAVPVLLVERGVPVSRFTEDLLERAGDGSLPVGDEEAVLREVLDMMACKAAVKAGDQLSRRELQDLLKMRETVERSSNCPHGRPTSLRLSWADLERQFGRSS